MKHSQEKVFTDPGNEPKRFEIGSRFFGSSTVCDNDNDKNFVRKQNVKTSRKSLHGFTNNF